MFLPGDPYITEYTLPNRIRLESNNQHPDRMQNPNVPGVKWIFVSIPCPKSTWIFHQLETPPIPRLKPVPTAIQMLTLRLPFIPKHNTLQVLKKLWFVQDAVSKSTRRRHGATRVEKFFSSRSEKEWWFGRTRAGA
jgi:hypothetical protein